MNFFLVVILAVIGTAYSRSVPLKPSDISVEVDSLSGNLVPLIRKVRQFGGGYGNGGYGNGGFGGGGYGNGGYNNFDYNPYNDTPNNYDANPFNDSAHRQTYNNFDLNPFNNSPNNYDANPYNDSTLFGKKKK